MTKNKMAKTMAVLLLGLVLSGCSSAPPATTIDTWVTIRDDILVPKCALCHNPNNSIGTQTSLNLTKDAAYNELVNVTPQNQAASAANLKLIFSGGSEDENRDNSFIWEKIRYENEEHFYGHAGYGQLMPPNDPLTNGEIEFIKQWIEKNAPETGVVVSNTVLSDTTKYTPAVFTALSTPDSGTQIHVGPFTVTANTEREFLYLYELNNAEPLFVNRTEISMRPGSHHFILYNFFQEPQGGYPQANEYRDLYLPNGTEDPAVLQELGSAGPDGYLSFLAGTQWPFMDYTLPTGVAIRVTPNTRFNLNAHNTNYTSSNRLGEIYINLHTIPSENVQHLSEIMLINNPTLVLPANQTTTLTFTQDPYMQMPQKRYVYQIFSHTHQKMTEFRAFIQGGPRDGEEVYYTNDWEHPPIKNFDPPLELNQNEGFKMVTTFHNNTNEEVNFGLSSTDEMMILFGNFYTD